MATVEQIDREMATRRAVWDNEAPAEPLDIFTFGLSLRENNTYVYDGQAILICTSRAFPVVSQSELSLRWWSSRIRNAVPREIGQLLPERWTSLPPVTWGVLAKYYEQRYQ